MTKLFSSRDPILVEATRTGRPEGIHQVHAVCVDDSGNVLGSFGDPEYKSYLRSSAKPFQLLTAIALRPSLLDECSDEELAVLTASHSGEPGHIETIARIQERHGLYEDLLFCGRHEPYYLPAHWGYGREGRAITSIHCNCSGKHTAMLLASQTQGWPLEGYTEADHPIQLANTRRLAEYLGSEPDGIEYGVDGCNVPTWWLTIRECAMAFARFASPSWPHSELEKRAVGRIFDAFHNAAWYIAGTKRFCVDFNSESDGHWLGKIGGEGIYCVSFRDKGIGVVVKVVDGNSRAIPPALLQAMRYWDLIEGDQLGRLARWVEVVRKNSSSIPIGLMRVIGDT
jgi:L-asparaginase II